MNKKVFWLSNVVNLIYIIILLTLVISLNSDKSTALIYFYYPLLIGINLIIGFVLAFFKNVISKVFFYNAGWLIIALIPIIIIVLNVA